MKFSELWQVFGDLCLLDPDPGGLCICGSGSTTSPCISVMDLNTLYLDPDPEVLLNLNPSLFTQFHYQHYLFKNLKMESEESSELRE